NDGAVQPGFRKLRRLDRDTRPLFAGLGSHAGLEVNDVDVPPPRNRGHTFFNLECIRNSALTARLLGPANRAARRQRSTRACRSASRSSNVSPARTTSTLLRALSRFLSSSIRRLSSSWIINGFPIGPRS